NKIQLSSANSINIGRLCPQVVYYFYSYCKLVNSGIIQLNDKVNFVVPTGNFGNILAGYYAKCLGLPINKLICASNENNVLTEFIQTGHYNKKRDFHKTISPSMDILVSSNVERYLFEVVNHNSDRVNELMNCLSATGEYKLNSEEAKRLNDDFTSYYANDDETKDTIRNIYNKYEKVIDPHTAVAMNCYEKYQHDTKDSTHTIILSTASPYKFAKDVVEAILKKEVTSQEQALLELSSLNKESMPYNLEQLLHIDVQNPTILKQKEVKSNLINELEKKHE
ncbi:MAG: threonine synthase, partial [Anaerorhabdus sp.]